MSIISDVHSVVSGYNRVISEACCDGILELHEIGISTIALSDHARQAHLFASAFLKVMVQEAQMEGRDPSETLAHASQTNRKTMVQTIAQEAEGFFTHEALDLQIVLLAIKGARAHPSFTAVGLEHLKFHMHVFPVVEEIVPKERIEPELQELVRQEEPFNLVWEIDPAIAEKDEAFDLASLEENFRGMLCKRRKGSDEDN